jgi:hypothetical protein
MREFFHGHLSVVRLQHLRLVPVLALAVPLCGCAPGMATLLTVPMAVDGSAALDRAAATGESFAAVAIPAGKSALYVYRESQFRVLVLPVSLNGKPWTNLKTNSFAVAIVNPGTHEITYPEYLPPLAEFNRAARMKNTPEKKLVVSAPADTPVFVKAESRRLFGQPNWNDIFLYFSQRTPEVALAQIAATKGPGAVLAVD